MRTTVSTALDARAAQITHVRGPSLAAARFVRVAAFVGVTLSAALYTVAHEPYGLWATAWIAPGLLLICVRRLDPLRAAAAGVLFGVLIGYGITTWAPYATLEYFGFNHALAWAFSFVVWLAYSGVPLGLMAFAYAMLAPGVPAAWRALLGAWLWVGSDLLRTTLLTGMPWGLLGHTQAANLPIVQVADLGGVYAVTFIVALVSAALAETLDSLAARGGSWRALGRHLAFPSVALAAVLAYGAHCLRSASADGSATTVAIVQGHIANQFRWSREHFQQTLHTYADLSRRAAPGNPDLIVWPENAVNFYVEQEPHLRAQLGRVARASQVGLIFGGPRLHAPTEARNSAYFMTPDGRIAATYDKRRLVPFAEYDPFSNWRAQRDRDELRYTAGSGAQLLSSGGARIGIVICYEVLFPALVRELVRDGAEMLVNLSNDTWMDPGDGIAPRQHLSMSVLRAVETRRPLVRAAASGPSAFITPLGEIESSLPTATAGSLVGRLHAERVLTPYVRFGDTWAVAGTLLALAAAIAVRVRRA